ncbi:MAG: preprotein translocase subunit YajC [Acidobacteria bacterium]|nr:preprotein translocase subunit YajC [Acidobacteriota bacterium]
MGPLFLLLIFAGMYFMTIRPQQQRVRRQRELVGSLEIGDEIVTVGGVVGHIKEMEDLELKVDSGGTMLRVARNSVTQRLTTASD